MIKSEMKNELIAKAPQFIGKLHSQSQSPNIQMHQIQPSDHFL